MDILLENIRSFNGLHRLPTRPLTILVGENSAGKTTFLASVASVLAGNVPHTRRMNYPPFEMGSYETIATYRGGKGGRARQFSIGFSATSEDRSPIEVISTFVERAGLPILRRVTGKRKDEYVDLTVDNSVIKARIGLYLPDQEEQLSEFQFEEESPRDIDRFEPLLIQSLLLRNVVSHFGKAATSENKDVSRSAFSSAYDFVHEVFYQHPSVLALAPVRSKPQRTYDQLSDDFHPEGDHIPVILSRLLSQRDSADGDILRAALERFGSQSGLFTKINVKRKGNKPSDPFQITVATGGPARNIMDVGYGVSQSLPVVVESVLTASERTLLLQQPEVHLHPRAQAALGSFFVYLVATRKKNFIVETHSDFLVDRVRQEVAEGRVPANDVQILFFERRQIYTKVYPISVDNHGNVIGAPKTYRRFFLEEQLKTLYGPESQK